MSRLDVPTTVLAAPAAVAPPSLVIANGTLEALKWVALVLMTLDHVNKYLFEHAVPALFAVGRIAMPLFVFVLAYNLARPGALEGGVFTRTATRLILYGTLASVPFIALGKLQGGWWPLNMMFSLFVATIVIGLTERGGRLCTSAAVAVFIIGGGLVEYWWLALSLAMACWRYCKQPRPGRLAAVIGSLALLWLLNQNPWAFAVLPLILLAPRFNLPMPRWPRFFYAYYPAHLGILLALSQWLH